MKDHAALLIRQNNQFLFVKRSKSKRIMPGLWAFPSGTKEEKESIEETAKREAFEELDVKIEIEKILAVHEVKEVGARLHFIVVKISGGNLKIKEENEIEELAWWTFKEFFERYSNKEIGNGLIYLRKNPELWREYKD